LCVWLVGVFGGWFLCVWCVCVVVVCVCGVWCVCVWCVCVCGVLCVCVCEHLKLVILLKLHNLILFYYCIISVGRYISPQLKRFIRSKSLHLNVKPYKSNSAECTVRFVIYVPFSGYFTTKF